MVEPESKVSIHDREAFEELKSMILKKMSIPEMTRGDAENLSAWLPAKSAVVAGTICKHFEVEGYGELKKLPFAKTLNTYVRFLELNGIETWAEFKQEVTILAGGSEEAPDSEPDPDEPKRNTPIDYYIVEISLVVFSLLSFIVFRFGEPRSPGSGQAFIMVGFALMAPMIDHCIWRYRNFFEGLSEYTNPKGVMIKSVALGVFGILVGKFFTVYLIFGLFLGIPFLKRGLTRILAEVSGGFKQSSVILGQLFVFSIILFLAGYINADFYDTLPEDKGNGHTILLYIGIPILVFGVILLPLVLQGSTGKKIWQGISVLLLTFLLGVFNFTWEYEAAIAFQIIAVLYTIFFLLFHRKTFISIFQAKENQ